MSILARLRARDPGRNGFKAIAHLTLATIQNLLGSTLYNRPPPVGPEFLNLGSGSTYYEGWVNADCYNFYAIYKRLHTRPDWMLDAGRPWNCPPGRFTGIFTEHMLEHMTYAAGITALSEIFKALKPGGWVRVVLPDIRQFAAFYMGEKRADPEFQQFASGAEAIAHVAQSWGHISLWDSALMADVLAGIGFIDVAEVSFGTGSDTRLIMDSPGRRWESFYVEARKPA